MPILAQLLKQGRTVSIENGRLVVSPLKAPIPQEQRETLLFEIATATSTELLTYESYSTGRYGRHKSEGVTLQFTCQLSDNRPYAIFNAELKRQRTTNNGRKGDRLPDGQFRITKRFELYKFWKRCQLNVPPRLSAFGGYMGNLKQVILIGEYSKGERLDCKSLTPFNISHDELLEAMKGSELINNSCTSHEQLINNSCTRVINKEIEQSHTLQGLELEKSTGDEKCGKTVIRERGNRGNHSLSVSSNKKKPQEQTTDEWLEDWDKVGMDSML